jgi:hypothetical protein
LRNEISEIGKQTETEFKHNFSKCDQKLNFSVHPFKHLMFPLFQTSDRSGGKESEFCVAALKKIKKLEEQYEYTAKYVRQSGHN